MHLVWRKILASDLHCGENSYGEKSYGEMYCGEIAGYHLFNCLFQRIVHAPYVKC